MLLSLLMSSYTCWEWTNLPDFYPLEYQTNQQPLSLEAQGPLPMTLSGYCLHIMKLPGKVTKKSRVTTDCPLYRKQSEASKVNCQRSFCTKLMSGQECYFLKNEKCWRKEGKKGEKKEGKGGKNYNKTKKPEDIYAKINQN